MKVKTYIQRETTFYKKLYITSFPDVDKALYKALQYIAKLLHRPNTEKPVKRL